MRNGPGLFEFEHQKAEHIFDGMAMIRRYSIDANDPKNPEGNVSRRLIESEFLKNNLAEKKFTDYGMGTIPIDTTMWKRIQALIEVRFLNIFQILRFKGFGFPAVSSSL